MNVFCDFHHGGLYYSMHLLWEKRLGAKLYTMGGMDWFDKGYWRINGLKTTAQQYLLADRRHHEGKEDYDVEFVSVADFPKIKFDYLVCTVLNHEEPWLELQKKYQPQAKVIRQFGNVGDWTNGQVPNIMNSTTNPVPKGINAVTWREEFSLSDFHFEEPRGDNVISSFLHNIKAWPGYDYFKGLKEYLPSFKVREYGANSCDDGCCPEELLADRMRESKFVYHVKAKGDGYGHNVHHAFACGRPLIMRLKDYQHQIGGQLMVPDKTIIDVSTIPVKECVKKILEYSEPARHRQMCHDVYDQFKKVVDFDKEEQDFRKFLERCK